ncbi:MULTISPECIES: AraC family transcriptional regulator [unclassified Halomonas]|uniref:AraC family transcriptional regulator n=1 Tax=unclassified Halomonas TaxID=2609666 RepID=UPI0006DB2715|nr:MULTISPECIES: AraC family transcriptional regulator [unclassified Halomonas]KPQ20666.1 MAG: AraC family protein [Halomonas sp. HL-93]SBR50792.1 AraC-type DNA-binding protein [Halomonas sp. HL-93]SNY97039.1 AraC-type DNA-binding protein [Halomonas sp. hl-4]
MNSLKQAVQTYAKHHATHDGLVLSPVPGLSMMCVETPAGDLQSVYKPMVCLVLQGAKRMTVGHQTRVVAGGESAIVSADMPVVGRIVQASQSEPYLAVAIDLDRRILRELTAHMGSAPAQRASKMQTLFAVDTDAEVIDCASRLMKLLDRPESEPLLRPGIMQELHYWLLSGPHGTALREIADPDSYASRLAAAIEMLRANYTSRVPVEKLAAEAGMSLSSFHKHFKYMTSLTPGQYQQRLRLIEARRLMLDEGVTASNAAFEVGYESVSQFTREYGRLFKAPPKRDALRLQKTVKVANRSAATSQRIGA